MKPFVKEKKPVKRLGSKHDALEHYWQFARDSFARFKRDTRRARRREDKQKLNNYE